MGRLTEEELANAVHIDPSQIRGLGPSLEVPSTTLLQQRKGKILETYETGHAETEALRNNFHDCAAEMSRRHPRSPRRFFQQAVAATSSCTSSSNSGIAAATSTGPFARQLLHLTERLGEKYQVDELASKNQFTGRSNR